MDTLTIIYIVVSIIVIIFETWYIGRLKKTIAFAIFSLNKFAQAMNASNPGEEIERINWDDEFKNFK